MNSSNELAVRWVRSAARAAPATLRERLEEEWLADLASRSSWLARLRFGAGCRWATRTIAHEFAAAPVAAMAAGGEQALALHHPHRTSGSRRSVSLLVIVGLHALGLYALTQAVRQASPPAAHPPTDIRFIDSNPTPLPPVPGPRGRLTETSVPPLTGPHDLKFDEGAAISLTGPGDTGGTSLVASPIHRVNGGPGEGFPATGEFYPAAAKILGEHGAAAVHVCVDAAGRLAGAPMIASSSGSPRLDQGALRLARAGSGYYRPTTENGQAVQSCYTFRVRFELRD